MPAMNISLCFHFTDEEQRGEELGKETPPSLTRSASAPETPHTPPGKH